MQKEQKFSKIVVLFLSIMMLAMGCTQKAMDQQTGQVLNKENNEPVQEQTPTPTPTIEAPQTEPTIREDPVTPDAVKEEQKLAQIMEDGTYVEDVSYDSPAGVEQFKFTLTVENDVVEAANIEIIKGSSTARNFVSKIDKELQTLMVGKSIDEISLPKRISGSSLTSAAVAKQFEQWKA